jgi:hypothetical protein
MKLVISTDSIGIATNPAHFKDVWGFVMKHKQFAGVEMLAWRNLEAKVKAFEKAHIPICGMHGKTGGMREATQVSQYPIYFLMQEVFAPIRVETQVATKYNLHYLLVHVEYARELLETKNEQIVASIPLLVENDIERSSHTKTLAAIKTLREKKIHANMVFDIVHAIRSTREPFDKAFDYALSLLTHVSPMAIHLPVGTYLSDSLPWEQMTQTQFAALARAISQVSPTYLIIENQQQRIYSYLAPKGVREKQRARNERIIEKMVKIGILQ